MPLQGSTTRLKAAVLLFHFALTRRLQSTVNLSAFVLFSSQGCEALAAEQQVVGSYRTRALEVCVEPKTKKTAATALRTPFMQCLSKKV